MYLLGLIRAAWLIPLFLVAPASVSAQRQPKTGAVAPDFTLKTLAGSRTSLSAYSGRPVLLNFWATWCAPCRGEMPAIVAAYRAHRAEGLEVLAVNSPIRRE